MTPSIIRVVLLIADGIAQNALQPTEEILRQFGVEYRQGVFHGGVRPEEGIRAIIVASVDYQAPAVLSASGIPVVRVPFEASDSAGRGLSLLVNEEEQDAVGEGFATVAIGEAGAKNAALLVVSMLAAQGDKRLHAAWSEFRRAQTEAVLGQTLSG